jgi:peptidyl-prolyl cis-trans isomerase C
MTDGRDKMAPAGLGHVIGLLLAVPRRPFEMAAVFLIAIGAIALEAVREGFIPYRPPPAIMAEGVEDPVLTEVGLIPLRLSDIRAQAGPRAADAPPELLAAQGFVEDAADQLALALLAEEEGLDEALEVRAALALARREVLSEAYLELAIRKAVSEEALRAAYQEEIEVLAEQRLISLRHILVAKRQEAEEIAARLADGADFAALARRQSLDAGTAENGGSFGMVPAAALPPALARVGVRLPVGTPSGPVRTESGWHLVRVDARRDLAIPPFESRREALAAELREKAIEDAVERAAEARANRRRRRETASAGLAGGG